MPNLQPDKTVSKKITTQSLVGFNLSEFAFAPLGKQYVDVAGSKQEIRWLETRGNETVQCFFQIAYGSDCPPINDETDEALFLIQHISSISSDPLRVYLNASQMRKLKGTGLTYKINGRNISNTVKHIQALAEMWIDSNYIYDPKAGKWKGKQARIISSIGWIDSGGRRRVTHVNQDGIRQLVEQVVMEIEYVDLSRDFLEHYMADPIAIDLDTLFSLSGPLERRIYRYGNKQVRVYGGGAMDFKQFCQRIGMSETYFDKYTVAHAKGKFSHPIVHVNDTGHMTVSIEKSKTDSGLKICFAKNTMQLALPSLDVGFSTRELEVYNKLKQAGIYPQQARKIVVYARSGFPNLDEEGEPLGTQGRGFGKTGPDFIDFVLRIFRKWIQSGGQERAGCPKGKEAGYLHRWFMHRYKEGEFWEWHLTRERRERKQQAKMLGEPEVSRNGLICVGDVLAPGRFSMDRFKSEHPEAYRRIIGGVHLLYSESKAPELGITIDLIRKKRDEALVIYCKMTWEEIQQGNAAFLPDIVSGG